MVHKFRMNKPKIEEEEIEELQCFIKGFLETECTP